MTIPVPGYLAPAGRYAGDDWAGANALKFYVYTVAPSTNLDGTANLGTPMDLTGFSVIGTIWKRFEGAPLPAPAGAILVDPSGNIITQGIQPLFVF